MRSDEELLQDLTRFWNEGDLESYIDLFAEDVEILADQTWPESSPVRGHDGIRRFWDEFRGVWEDVQLRLKALHHGDEAVAADCQWVTRGRASGLEGAIDFAIVLWPADGRIARGQFFEDLPDALAAAGVGDRSRG
jgi:ketosteroid isomerase-like protein